MGFRSISLKAELVSEIEEFVKQSGRYRSVADFIAEACRLRLEQLTMEKKTSYSVAPHVLTVENEPLQKQKQEDS